MRTTAILIVPAFFLAAATAASPASAGIVYPDSADVAAELDSLRSLARDSPADAIPKIRDELVRLERLPVHDPLSIASAINILVAAALKVGPPIPGDIPVLADRAIAIRDSLQGPSHEELSRTIYQRAILHRVAGEYEAARRLGGRVLAMREEALGPDDPEVAALVSFCARVENQLGDHEGALELAERALAIRERAFGSENSKVASSVGLVALTNLYLGRYPEARRLYGRVVDLQTRLLGPEHRNTLAAMHNLGLVLQMMRELPEAGEIFERLLEIRQRTLDPNDPTLAKTLSSLSYVRWWSGDRERALELAQQALAIREHAYGPDHPDIGGTLGDIGTLQLELGRPVLANEAFERALRILENAYGPDHLRVAVVLNNLGTARYAEHRYEEADALLRRALAIRESTLEPTHPDVLTTLHNLAEIAYTRGELAFADSLMTRVVTEREQRLGPRHPRLARSLVLAARIRRARGDDAAAFEAAERAERIDREHFDAIAPALTERQAVDLALEMHEGLGVMIDLAAAGDGVAARTARAWDAVVRSRAIVLDEMAARRRRVVEAGRAELRVLADSLAAVRGTLAALVLEEAGGVDASDYSAHIENVWRERERLERALAMGSRAFAEGSARREVGVETVLEALPARSALIAFVEERAGSREDEGHAEVQPRYVAFVGRSADRDVSMLALGNVGEIDARVRDWRREVAPPAADASSDLLAVSRGVKRESPGRGDALRRSGEALRSVVWDPLVPYLADVDRVFVVPDGSLDLVSLAALPMEQRFLLEEPYVIGYLGTERELAVHRDAAGTGILVVGSPAFDVEVAPDEIREEGSTRGFEMPCAGAESLHFAPLDGARREADLVCRRLRDVLPIVHLEGSEASESALVREAPGKRMLHVATHGFVLDDRCAPPGDGPSPDVVVVRPATAATNALLLSGLALAGANQREGRASGDDGVLTAEEIAGMDLSSVECVVLSACDTGGGEVLPSEGVFGLRRAFEIAGAGALVMSLWPVNDAVGVDWMRAFYEARITGGMDAAGAARAAALSILREQRRAGHAPNPYYWGAFVVTGRAS